MKRRLSDAANFQEHAINYCSYCRLPKTQLLASLGHVNLTFVPTPAVPL